MFELFNPGLADQHHRAGSSVGPHGRAQQSGKGPGRRALAGPLPARARTRLIQHPEHDTSGDAMRRVAAGAAMHRR